MLFKEEKISSANASMRKEEDRLNLALCHRKIAEIDSFISKVEYSKDSTDAVNLSNRLLSNLNQLYKDTKNELVRFLFSTYQLPPAELQRPVNATIDYSEKVIYLSFDALPAKRSKNLYDRNHTYSVCFNDALDNAYSWYRQINGLIPRYDERVVLWYVIHYKKGENICDYDNYDFKPITDSIASFFLQDDNPQFISQFFDACEDTKNFLEVRILPRSQF